MSKRSIANERFLRVLVNGRVQGVGFRPFVCREARGLGLRGWVRNTPAGVEIQLEGADAAVDAFLGRLRSAAPPAADVRSIDTSLGEAGALASEGFHIVESATSASSSGIPFVPQDRAACPACQAEFLDPSNRRFGYALNACVDCGPRFTAITVLPFDRERTTMVDFSLCPACARDYEDPTDRRFHAEMTGCVQCGPRLWLEESGTVGRPSRTPDDRDVLERAARRLRAGGILALEGIGGFHLLCDASSERAVGLLRERKRRERKPFAVVFADIDDLTRELEADSVELEALREPAAPIVLLRRRGDGRLASSVAPGLGSVGAMLAYTPALRALARLVGRPLVATSANATDEPMPIANDVARAELSGVVDAFLMHDRRINRPADDSVVRVIAGRAVPLRVGRGLAPVRLTVPAELPPMLAVGGHLKAAVAFARGNTVVLGPHVGDLGTAAVRRRYREVLDDLARLLGVEPTLVVHDLHPDYHSTRVAHELGLPRVVAQHHVAHAAATLAEHGEVGPALGISWDGTGLGDDGGIWGGEFFRVEPGRVARVASLWPFPLVGGDRAAREPRRCAAGLLAAAGLWPDVAEQGLASSWFTAEERRWLDRALESPLASSPCTSVGRLFDGWAALMNLCDRSAYEAEAAMRLEDRAGPEDESSCDARIISSVDSSTDDIPHRLDWRPWLLESITDLERGVSPRRLSARFHQDLAEGCVAIAQRVGLETVVLGGGCFQNARLSGEVQLRLARAGFRVLAPLQIPPGDGGLAVGQIWAAALGLGSVKIGGLGELCVRPGKNR